MKERGLPVSFNFSGKNPLRRVFAFLWFCFSVALPSDGAFSGASDAPANGHALAGRGIGAIEKESTDADRLVAGVLPAPDAAEILRRFVQGVTGYSKARRSIHAAQ